MAHRGRLNVLANIVGKTLRRDLPRVRGRHRPDDRAGLGRREVPPRARRASSSSRDRRRRSRSTLASNPRHLEAVDPVVEGMARAKQDLHRATRVVSRRCRCCIHGDAAFAGQGVVAETLNLSELRGYRTGGTIHLVINNQVGFTTAPAVGPLARIYATDVAKMVQAPIFHVNGDDPEACVRVGPARVRLPPGVPQGRRHRHGLLPPARPQRGRRAQLTQPLMYERIDERRRVRKLYTEALVNRGDITVEEAEARPRRLPRPAAGGVRRDAGSRAARRRPGAAGADSRRACCPTSTPASTRERARPRSPTPLTAFPTGFTVASEARQAARGAREDVSEARRGRLGARRDAGLRLAAARGHRVRLAGAGHPPRHVLPAPRRAGRLRDRARAAIPLAHLGDAQGAVLGLRLACSREYAALGFEYGYSVVDTDALVLWEAQFGDFVNGAQIIIDQFIVGRRGQVGPDSGARAAAAARLRGAGARALARPASSASSRCAPRTTCRSSTRRRRPSTSTSCGARCARRPQAAGGVHARSRCCADGVARSPVDELTRLVPGGARRPGRAARRCCPPGTAASGKVAYERWRARRVARAGGGPAGRAALPVARDELAYPSRATSTPATSSGSRRSPRTWAPGRS